MSPVDGERPSPHRVFNPPELAPPLGFAHAVAPAPGRTVYLGGQAGHGPDGRLTGETLVEHYRQACAGVVRALEAAGGRPEHLVSIQIFVTDVEEYRNNLRAIGQIYRQHFGHHYPAIGLFQVSGLFDPGAKVELMCVAIVPDDEADNGATT